MFESIIALATPPMKSALAVIRLSGDNALTIMEECFSKPLANIEKRSIVYGYIKDQEKIVDEVILNVYPDEHSYTGEPLVEIQCHGSMVIVREIIALLIKHGARNAERGEFTARAFYHGRMDLVQAEAVNDIINASTSEAKALAVLSLRGQTSAKLMPVKTLLADLLSLIEVNIDYPEYEDIEQITTQKIIDETRGMVSVIDSLIQDGKNGKIVKDGLKIAIVGKPNVGKSSLLNALMEEQKAIVTDIAGTTRDVIEGDIFFNGLTLHLFDTAGIHDSQDAVETIGIKKAQQTMKDADLVILLIDGSNPETQEDLELRKEVAKYKHLVVYNKKDLFSLTRKDEEICISAQLGDIHQLKKALKEIISIDEKVYQTPSFTNERQLGLLEKARLSLLKAQEECRQGLTLDLISVHIQEAYQNLLCISGEAKGNDFTEEIFSRFCVGK